MARRPPAIDRFLQAKRLAVAGVSRDAKQPANAIFRRLRGHVPHVFAINPNTSQVEGVRCFPDVLSLPEPVEGVVIATHPDVAGEVVRQCAQAGVARVWMHRSFGQGSVSDAAVVECERQGIECIVGGCPLMFCEPVDLAHKCMRWWLQHRGRAPA